MNRGFVPKVYTPAALAERWECSERHVRNMIETGEIQAFRLGEKLLRIRAEVVEAFEWQSGELPDSVENSASLGTKATSGAVIDLEHQIQKRRPASPRLDLRNSRAREVPR
ncbi:hypothetical protein C1M53_31630 [Mesorhizobium sp. Pch-S]|nr:hypothetical protein C1M53_31630 [Mesorhizobium sp. Pch-S]